MKVETKETSSVRRELSVEIPAKDVDKCFDKIYKAIKRQAKIKGFRPGKTPRPILEKYYGPQAMSEASETLVGDSYADALSEAGVEPIAQPSFDFEPPEQGKDFRYKVFLDVKPEFELEADQYKGLEIKIPDLKVNDEEINNRLDELRDQHAVLTPLEEERPAAMGDVVVVNYQSFVDDEPMEGGSADNVDVELGKGKVQEEIELALIKTKPGDMVETTVSYDENTGSPQVQGKDVLFKLLVKEIKVKVLPELDDDFARSVSAEFESLDGLKERIKDELEKAYEEQRTMASRAQIMDKLRDLVEFEMPESLLEAEIEDMKKNFENRLRQSGINPEDAKLDDEKMSADFRDSAEKKLRSGIVLGKVAELEKVDVEEADREAEYQKLADSIGQPAKIIKEMHIKNNMIASLDARLLEEKTLQVIRADAIIEEVDPADLAQETE